MATAVGHGQPVRRLTEAVGMATDDSEGVVLSVDIDVCDPGHAPGPGTPEPPA